MQIPQSRPDSLQLSSFNEIESGLETMYTAALDSGLGPKPGHKKISREISEIINFVFSYPLK